MTSPNRAERGLKRLDNVLSWFRSIGDKTGQQFTLTSRAAREIKGRARTIEEAILWHGGEGDNSKNAFMNASEQDRQKLINFIESL